MIENDKLINLQRFRVLQLEREFSKDYGQLLENLTISEISSEVAHFVEDINTRVSLKKSFLLKGKLILQELKKRCLGNSKTLQQITPFVKEVESELSGLRDEL